MVCLDTENGFISLSGSSIILIIKFNIYLHLVSPFWIDIYIYIYIYRYIYIYIYIDIDNDTCASYWRGIQMENETAYDSS